jgi:hypothetical protein
MKNQIERGREKKVVSLDKGGKEETFKRHTCVFCRFDFERDIVSEFGFVSMKITDTTSPRVPCSLKENTIPVPSLALGLRNQEREQWHMGLRSGSRLVALVRTSTSLIDVGIEFT